MMPEETVVHLPHAVACFLRMFLSGAVDEMKANCSVKEAEDPAVQITFAMLGMVIRKLPDGEAEITPEAVDGPNLDQ